MIKKFFVAAIVGLLVLSSQIATAAWNDFNHCNTKAELARWIEDGRREGHTVFNFTLANFKVDNREELIKFAEVIANQLSPTTVGSVISVDEYGVYGAQFTYTMKKEYPGTHVANAYLSSDKRTAWLNLSDEERILYSEALKIVNEANKRSSEREKARYIHDEICKHVKEYKVENDRNTTATGALIDGYAHCQGFTDAFYMLGRMCDLEVGRIGGTINNGETGHSWNTIILNGRTYFVDVTQDYVESSDKYKYFIVPSQTLKNNSYWCHWEIIPNLQ